MTNNIEEEVKKLVSEITEIPMEKLTPTANFIDDLGMDSLKAIEIIAAFEKKYRVIIPENDIQKIKNLKKLTEYTKK
ncbi:acyl carrier protein [Candidatus Poribacteria bacterium]|nr:acyl carrier protein [Candidatus Poribacteria bacterium]